MDSREKVRKILQENEEIRGIDRVDTAVILKALSEDNLITEEQAKAIYDNGYNFSGMARARAYIQNDLKQYQASMEIQEKRRKAREKYKNEYRK